MGYQILTIGEMSSYSKVKIRKAYRTSAAADMHALMVGVSWCFKFGDLKGEMNQRHNQNGVGQGS